MGALWYLYWQSFKNRAKKAVKKPVTYVYLVIILFYVFMMPYSLRVMFGQLNLASPEGMTAVFTVFAFWIIPGNLIAYAKRKGLVFRHSDIHFQFPSPISPKKLLLYAHMKTLLATLLLNLVLVLCGAYIFHVAWWRMLLYFLFSVGIENVLEACIMLTSYGSERLSEKGRDFLIKGAYLLIGIFVVLGIYTYFTRGMSFDTVLAYLHSDAVQLVPFVGWYIAILHLLFIGPTIVNVTGSLLYFVLFVVMLCLAIRMPCSGEYYEDAEKFADDYEEVLASRKQGRTDVKLGKKKKVLKASITYRGKGAKAIFYRQLLEYKKNKYFIFDINTIVSLLTGLGIAYLYRAEGGFGAFNDFIVPAAMAYMIFIFSAFTGKWGKELLTPYTFLIPDNPFRKLFYATLMQHIQALVNGVLFVLPPAIVMDLPVSTAILSVLGYVMLSACKLYVLTVGEVAVGNTLGNVGKQMFRLFIQGIVIVIVIIAAVLGFVLHGIDMAYILMLVVLAGMVAILMTLSTLGFYRMETVK